MPAEGVEDMRRGIESLREQNVRVFDGLFKARLAEGEARAADFARAIAILDEAREKAEQIGHRTFDVELHRVRGEILLGSDSVNVAPAEAAFRTAIAVAKQQGTRSFELRGAVARQAPPIDGPPRRGPRRSRAGDRRLRADSAKSESRAGDVDRALVLLDKALATSGRTGHRSFEAELHRARGETLLKQNPASPAPAEEAFLTAIAVAKQRGARSFELLAALSLAKLYQSTARLTEADAVLAPALDGFAPTPEMPEIEEAREMLATIEAVRICDRGVDNALSNGRSPTTATSVVAVGNVRLPSAPDCRWQIEPCPLPLLARLPGAPGRAACPVVSRRVV